MKAGLARAAVGVASALVLLHLFFAAMILWWADHPPAATAFMTERMQVLRERDPKAKLRYAYVPYERISPTLKRAMIAAEDAKFVDHEGFDWDGIEVALEKN